MSDLAGKGLNPAFLDRKECNKYTEYIGNVINIQCFC